MDSKSTVEKYKSDIEMELEKYLAPHYPSIIYEAMAYSCLSGGKRLRPTLLLSASETFGCPKEKALPFACALEMIHTYSLIHDDLPAMDNDDLRRGKPTNHIVFGEGMAMLAGDALLNLAYEIMVKSCIKMGDISAFNAMEKIATSSGINGMIGGQVVDVISENKSIDKETLLYIHNNKTAALIKASLSAGALLGNADDGQLALFEDAGKKLGLAFQIKDDILDITSTDKILGKSAGSDEKNQKSTYISIFGKEKACEDYLKLSNDAITILKSIGNSFLVEYAETLVDRKM